MFGRTGMPYGAPYRYGFNGKENDDDVKGIGNQQDYGMRIYDPRVGRFLSVDPIAKSYESPYSAFANNPINVIDPDGADTININRTNIRIHLKGQNDGHSDHLYKAGRVIVTQSGEIVIKQASGSDVFRITNTTIDIDENGNNTSSNTITLELNNPQTFGRTGGHNMKGFIDDRFALAAHAPKWLLNYYAEKSQDLGVRSAMMYQKDLKALPYITATTTIAQIIFTGGITGAFFRYGNTAAIGFKSMREFTNVYGTAPKGMNWHHYVEQRLAGNGTFSPQLIYSTRNSVLISSGANSPHTAISAYYSRILSYTEGKTLRKWLEGRSFEEQLKFGKDIYNKVMKGQTLQQ
jgi:RHS repeat-associated protein